MKSFIETARNAGIEAVNESGLDVEELLATLRFGHDRWSEAAAGARVHALLGFDGLSDDDRQAFYRAYDAGAEDRIRELTV